MIQKVTLKIIVNEVKLHIHIYNMYKISKGTRINVHPTAREVNRGTQR